MQFLTLNKGRNCTSFILSSSKKHRCKRPRWHGGNYQNGTNGIPNNLDIMEKIKEIQNLMDSRTLNSDSECELFEKSIQNLQGNISLNDIENLLKVFYDETNNDEIMFSLIHLIETLRGEDYLKKIAIFSPLMTDAHEWAMTLNKRILNSQTFFEMYTDIIKSLNSDSKKKILALLDDIKEDNPQRFSEKIEVLKSRIKI